MYQSSGVGIEVETSWNRLGLRVDLLQRGKRKLSGIDTTSLQDWDWGLCMFLPDFLVDFSCEA